MESVKKRIFYLDELRTIAILLVIFCHTCQYFPTTVEFLKSPTMLSYVSIGRLGVPLFFMLSGALLIGKEYTLGSFFKKRFTRILIPAIFWTTILLIVNQIFLGKGYIDLNFMINHAGFPWFVYAILGIYIFIPVLNSFIKEYGDRGAGFFIILWLIYIIANNLNYTNEGFNLIFDSFGMYIGYPVLGYYLANKNFKIYSIPMIIISGLILIAFLIINFNLSWTQVHIIQYNSLTLIIATSALFLLLRYISRYCELNRDSRYSKFHYSLMNSWAGKLIYIISVSSYTIYLMQNMVINFFRFNFTIDKFYMVPQTFLMISVLCILIVLILARIPIINRISGVHY